jgi:hypothetical protein
MSFGLDFFFLYSKKNFQSSSIFTKGTFGEVLEYIAHGLTGTSIVATSDRSFRVSLKLT